MHQYLRSIGFSQITREQDIDKLLKGCEKKFMDTARRYVDDVEQLCVVINAPFGDRMGLSIVGTFDDHDRFRRLGYFPYLYSDDVSSTVTPSIYRRVDGTFFSAIIDDPRVGMTIIFQLVNPVDYLLRFGEGSPVTAQSVRLTGFCTKGCVLLAGRRDNNGSGGPVAGLAATTEAERSAKSETGEAPAADGKNAGANGQTVDGQAPDGQAQRPEGQNSEALQPDNKGQDMEALLREMNMQSINALLQGMNGQQAPGMSPQGTNGQQTPDLPLPGANGQQMPGIPPQGADVQDARMSLYEAARNGQTEAIEQLAFEEMSTIAMLSKRLQNEDIYSIVNSVFMPQGVECDIYLVVGDILKIEILSNEKTGEKIYDLTLNVNDMIIHVAINEADLEGEPIVGRRFKGRIWLQGRIKY